MPYNQRLYSQTSIFDHAPEVATDEIELTSWQISAPYLPTSPSNTYTSSDKLLPSIQETFLREPSTPSLNLSIPPPRRATWHRGSIFSISVVAFSLVLNVIITAWASKSFGVAGGIGTIHQGPCHEIKTTGLWLHIGINILSTTLLGASNYCMQCLCAPTRSEVEDAHAKKQWLDIGIQSFRNLTKIRKGRMVLWIFLAASSVPLHLMFNSAIFVSLTANEYVVAAVSEDFLTGSNWTLTGWDDTHASIISSMQQNVSSYERLSQASCIQEYGVDYLSPRRHVLVVVSGQFSNPLLGIMEWDYNVSQNSWVCGADLGPDMKLLPYDINNYDCSIQTALGNSTWIIASQPALYCLSEKVDDKCRLQFALPIFAVVVGCNFIKLICLIITIWKCKEETFITLGDALSSFLERPDLWTEDMCIATKKDFGRGRWPERKPARWTVRRHFRFEACGVGRFILTNVVCAIALTALSTLLYFAIENTTTSSDITTLWHLGFGTVTASSLIRWSVPELSSPGLLKNILIANSPQVILSILYIAYNRMYTCMSFSKEWHEMAHNRLPLRVTSPRGHQLAARFLSLPYRYLISISIVSVASHWILSQSLFLVAIDVFDLNGTLDPTQSILTCGFSCIALIFLIAVGVLVFSVGVGTGLRRYEGGMPLAGSCSAALSAACHPRAEEVDVALEAVKWGVVSAEGGVGHCSLSGRYVSPPITWRWYMGKRDSGL